MYLMNRKDIAYNYIKRCLQCITVTNCWKKMGIFEQYRTVSKMQNMMQNDGWIFEKLYQTDLTRMRIICGVIHTEAVVRFKSRS